MPEQDESLLLITDMGESYTLLPNLPLPKGVEGPTTFLGKGAFGTVSVGFTSSYEPVAVKLMELDKTDPQFSDIMNETKKEIAIMKRLGRQADCVELVSDDDPNKVKLYIIQPFVKGVTLAQYFAELAEKNTAPENQNDDAQLRILNDAISCFIAALEATIEIHRHGVIHGDLHPGNILYDPDTHQATVIDFGLSVILEAGQDKVYVSGDAEISNFHRAPETIKAKKYNAGRGLERVYDKSTDGYSLAIDCAISSDFVDYRLPQIVGGDMAEILSVFRDLSQEKLLGGNSNPADRISVEAGLEQLKKIQKQLAIRAAQKQFFEKSTPEIQEIAKKFAATNSFRYRARQYRLPTEVQDDIRNFAKKMRAKKENGSKLQKNGDNPIRSRPIVTALGQGKRSDSRDGNIPPQTQKQTKKIKPGGEAL